MDLQKQEELKAHLLATDEQFRKLADQHAEYKKRVEELEAKAQLSTEEEVEEHRLKKLKLHLKDQMMEMINRYEREHPAAV